MREARREGAREEIKRERKEKKKLRQKENMTHQIPRGRSGTSLCLPTHPSSMCLNTQISSPHWLLGQ